MTLRRTLCCVLLLAGCADRQVDVDDDLPELLPGCMVITGRGYFDDGSSKTLTTEAGFEGGAPSVCMCMTKEELNERIWAEELNELAYVECKRIEELQGFDWTNCQANYESGEWVVAPATGEDAWLNYDGLDCDGEPDESCSITNPDDGDPMLALVFIVLLGLRRRHDSA